MKKIYSDEYTTIEDHGNYDLVIRHYLDIPDIKVKLESGEGERLANDMIKADNSDDSFPGHYISRHVLEFGYAQYGATRSAAKSLGSIRTERKAEASRANGAKGGRPSKCKVCGSTKDVQKIPKQSGTGAFTKIHHANLCPDHRNHPIEHRNETYR